MIASRLLSIENLPGGGDVLALAAAGADWFAATSVGLYRTSDGGQSWADMLAAAGILAEMIVPAVAVSPNYHQDRTVFAGVAGGILRSTDGGAAWALARAPKPEPVISTLALSPGFGQDGLLYAGTVEDGVLQSTDRGASWFAWNFQLLDFSILSLGVSPNLAADHTLFAGTSTGIFASRTGGRAWHEVDLPCGYAAVMGLLALGEGVLLAGTEQNGLFRSVDNGQSWVEVGPSETGAVLGLAAGTGGQLAANTGAGLILSPDAGLTWQTVGLNLPEGVDLTALAPLEEGWLVGLSDGTLRVVS